MNIAMDSNIQFVYKKADGSVLDGFEDRPYKPTHTVRLCDFRLERIVT